MADVLNPTCGTAIEEMVAGTDDAQARQRAEALIASYGENPTCAMAIDEMIAGADDAEAAARAVSIIENDYS